MNVRQSNAGGRFWGGVVVGVWLCLCGSVWAQSKVSPQQILAYKPIQKDVDCDYPTQEEIPQCKVEEVREGKSTGYLLLNPQGLVLRRFMDTDADGIVDQFQYFKLGLEVYRDNDTDGNKGIDQSRWLNTAGTRWGIDRDEDGRIDFWKAISAEEASREAVRALVARDERMLQAVLINAEDVRRLELSKDVAGKILESAAEVTARMKQNLSGSKIITPQTRWLRFDSSMLMPNVIPGNSGKSPQDLYVYENVMAIVETAGETGFVQIGEMVRVGEAWKLTQIPKPLEGEQFEIAEGGILLQPSLTAAAAVSGGLSPEVQELINALRELDEKAEQTRPTGDALSSYNVERARLLRQLSSASSTEDERELWMRQMLEHISAATQMGFYPKGVEQLRTFEQQLRRDQANVQLVAFAVFQRMVAEYNLELQGAAPADRGKVQEKWLKSLQSYVKEFPQAENAPDALLQMAITYEFNGTADDLIQARAWYGQLVKDYPNAPAAARARGALRRLELKGKPMVLSGKALGGGTIDMARYRGKVVLLIFWATWCKPCTDDLPQIQELYRTHQREGFEVVGVNLDTPGPQIQQYIDQYRVTWPHIHEEGDLHSRPAVEYGVVTVPTMFLIDKSGTVVDANASVEQLKKLVPELVKR